MEAEIRGKRRWNLQGVSDEDAGDARFFAAPVRESLADLLAGVAVGALREFVREARLPRVLPGLHPGFLPRLLGIRGAHVELHFPDRRRRRYSCADRDPQRALLGAFLLRPGYAFGLARPDHDARARAFLAEALAFGAPRAGLDLLALVRASLLQPHRGRVDLRELRLQVGAPGVPVAFAQRHEVLREREPAHRRRRGQDEDEDDRSAPGLLRDRLAALALPYFPAPGNAKLNERGRHRGEGADHRRHERFGKV